MGLFGSLDTASHICQGEHDDDDDGDDDDDDDDDDDNLHKCHDDWDFLVHWILHRISVKVKIIMNMKNHNFSIPKHL